MTSYKSIALYVGVTAIMLMGSMWFMASMSVTPQESSVVKSEVASPVSNRGEIGNSDERASENHRRSTIAVPLPYQFGQGRWVVPVEGEYELFARYATSDLATITAFYTDYGATKNGESVFSFHNEDELRWLVENGYPTPDDILAASRMADSELEKLSEEGNFKAKIFLLNRLDRTALSAKVTGSTAADIMATKIHSSTLASEIISNGSAFGAYAYAKHAEEHGKIAMAAASLSYAAWLGDGRRTFLEAFLERHGDLSDVEILNSYQIILLTAALRNHQLENLRQMARRPKFGA